jgi:hypothetical protein
MEGKTYSEGKPGGEKSSEPVFEVDKVFTNLSGATKTKFDNKKPNINTTISDAEKETIDFARQLEQAKNDAAKGGRRRKSKKRKSKKRKSKRRSYRRR